MSVMQEMYFFLSCHFPARNLSKVGPLEGVDQESYAGFMTVNKAYQSNMFFWFFPAQVGTSTTLIESSKRSLGERRGSVVEFLTRSRLKGCRFEPHRRHCVVVLEQDTFILA